MTRAPTASPTPFRTTYDPSHRLLRIVMSGLWDAQITIDFIGQVARLYAMIEAGKPQVGGGRIMIDLREFHTQPVPIAAQLSELVPRFAKLAGRIAVVQSISKVQNLQAERILADRRCKMFVTEEDGLAWLFGHEALPI